MENGVRILIVEDEEEVSSLIREVLKPRAGYIDTAGSMSEALAKIQRTLPDLIILDRVLPDGDGSQFCAFLRRHEETKHIPVLFVSALNRSGEPVPASDYVRKPFDPTELVARAEALLTAPESIGLCRLILET